MSIRIGDSCCKSLSMITPQSKVVETRRFLKWSTQWKEISQKCIAENKFLILTPCIGYDGKVEYYPTESQWRNIIEDCVVKLLSYGGNLLNCRIDIINETYRYCKDNQRAANYINWAYSQARGRIKIGAGCDELVYRDYYNYICANAKFDTLVIHIQSACSTEDKTRDNTAFAWNLAYKKGVPIDCNEANWFDVATSSGYSNLKMQLRYAEQIGCQNFCVVFNNLVPSAFNEDTSSWKFLCFKINGALRSPYWNEWTSLMESKAPIPNIPEEEIEEDMKLEILKIGSKGNQVQWLQEILELEYGFENEGGYDGVFGKLTDAQVKAYQEANGLVVDGIVGKATMTDLINKAELPDDWYRKLIVYMSYE